MLFHPPKLVSTVPASGSSGFGILMICAIVSVNYYFERLRGTASGIAMSGAGVGYLCVPFLFSYLVPRFGWRYTLLLYSASIFVLLVSAVLVIRPFVIVASDGSEVDEEHTENVKQTQVGHPTTNVSRANGAVPERSEHHPGSKENGPEAPDNEVSMAPLTILALADDDQLSVGETAFSTASRTRAYLANIKEDKAAKLVMPLGDETLADTGDHVNCELKDTPTPQSFANRSGQYQLRQNGLRTSGPLAAVNEQADDDLGSTVGSRLWKSTLAFKRSNPPPRSQRTYSSSRIRSVESRDASSHPNVKCKSAGKKSFVLDPFEQMDVFFSGSLASLGYYDTHRTRHTSEQRSTLFSSQLHDPSRFGSLQSSAIQSINHVEPSQTQFYCPRVGFTDIADRPSELLGDYEKRPPSSWLSKVDEADWYGQRNNYITSEETVNHQATWDSEYRLNKVLRFREWIVTVFDLKLFTIPSFLFITAIGVATQLAYFIPFVYLTDFAMSKGMEQNDANLLLVILGATHTIGRIMSGCAANMSWVDTVYLSGLGSLFAAAVTLLLPSAFPVGFAWYGVYAATFGISVAFPIPMVPIILVRFLGLQRLTASYSNLNMIKGIASVVGPLIADFCHIIKDSVPDQCIGHFVTFGILCEPRTSYKAACLLPNNRS
ncbi:unnamed protein product [Dicrocoelium dendriticum]|nr:unnamed protein product [Dicrocoelium dendriticum]